MNKKDLDIILDSKTVTSDLLTLILGEKLGFGAGRDVYECKLDPSLVVKIELVVNSFQNIREWDIWNDCQEIKNITKWLAPCVDISECGTVLLQKKAEPIRESELPEKLPAFLSDIKLDNLGILDKKIVCFDYGFTNRLMSTKMKKVKWNK